MFYILKENNIFKKFVIKKVLKVFQLDPELAFSEKLKAVIFFVSLRKYFYMADFIQAVSKWVPNTVEEVNFNFLLELN